MLTRLGICDSVSSASPDLTLPITIPSADSETVILSTTVSLLCADTAGICLSF